MPPSKYREFRELAARREIVCFEEYGEVLYYGYERRVPDAIRQEMAEEYGIDEEYMRWLIEDGELARRLFLKEKEAEDDKRIGEIVAMLKKRE